MTLSAKIDEDLKTAIKAKDSLRVSCMRMLKTSVKNMQVQKGRNLTEEEIEGIISSLVRKGNEAIKEFKEGGRDDLVQKEQKEIEIFYEYLPKQLTPEEIEDTLRTIIVELSVQGPKELGKVMKVAMSRMAGQAQGKEVNDIARKLMS